MSMNLVARWPRLRHYKERHESALSGGGTARARVSLLVAGFCAAAAAEEERARSRRLRRRTEGKLGSASVSAAEPAAPSRRVGTSGPRGVTGG